jgi:hypothetical protein
MPRAQLRPQAEAIFNARLNKLIEGVEKDITAAKQRRNANGVLISSMTVMDIYERVNTGIAEMAQIAADSAKAAYEAGPAKFSKVLESDLLNAFEENFARGYPRMRGLREHADHVRKGLANPALYEHLDTVEPARRAKLEQQVALRAYFQEKRRAWLEGIISRVFGTGKLAAALTGLLLRACT